MIKVIQNRGILINGGQVTYSLNPAFYEVCALWTVILIQE